MNEIKANEGHYLTQVGEVGEDRIFVKALKGANINPLDWREATAEEKAEYESMTDEKIETDKETEI